MEQHDCTSTGPRRDAESTDTDNTSIRRAESISYQEATLLCLTYGLTPRDKCDIESEEMIIALKRGILKVTAVKSVSYTKELNKLE